MWPTTKMCGLVVICRVLHLFNFGLQVTGIALLTEEGFLESLNDSSFQVAVQSWWKLLEGVEIVSMVLGHIVISQTVLYGNVMSSRSNN